MRELAPGEDAQVAAVTSNRADFMTFVLACQQIGVCYTPISSHLTESEIAYIVRTAAPTPWSSTPRRRPPPHPPPAPAASTPAT